jgi:hypothetical protein
VRRLGAEKKSERDNCEPLPALAGEHSRLKAEESG